MSTNFFAKGKTTAAPAKKAGKKAKARHQIKSLHQYAAVVAAMKTLETMAETLKAEVNESALDFFVGAKNDESFEGHEGTTEASMQLRKRTSRSALSEQEKDLLDQLGISTELQAASTYVINNAYSANEELLAKVSAALSTVEGIPADFIQASPEKFVTTKNSLRETFEKVKADELRDVLKVVGVPAARCVFGGSHEEMVKILDGMLKDAKDGPGFGNESDE